MADLYRKSSIEKLSNPEQLDKAITITSPMSWLALSGVLFLVIVTLIWSFNGTLPTTVTVNGMVVSPADSGAVTASAAGTITEIVCETGTKVYACDTVAKMKNSAGDEMAIIATESGTVTDILVSEGSKVYAGAEICRYTPEVGNDQIVVCYVPVTVVQQLKEEMKVLLYPYGVDSQEYGHMEAEIKHIGEYAVSVNNMWYVLGADNMIAEQFVANGPVVAVSCIIKEDTKTKSGFYWSSENGKNLVVANGTYVSAKIVTEECAPITKLIRSVKEKLGD